MHQTNYYGMASPRDLGARSILGQEEKERLDDLMATADELNQKAFNILHDHAPLDYLRQTDADSDWQSRLHLASLPPEAAAAYRKAIEEEARVLGEADQLAGDNVEIMLRQARLLVELTPDDSRDQEKMLRRVVSTVNRRSMPSKEDRFCRARAMFALAGLATPVDAGLLRYARIEYEAIGYPMECQKCDEAIARAGGLPSQVPAAQITQAGQGEAVGTGDPGGPSGGENASPGNAGTPSVRLVSGADAPGPQGTEDPWSSNEPDPPLRTAQQVRADLKGSKPRSRSRTDPDPQAGLTDEDLALGWLPIDPPSDPQPVIEGIPPEWLPDDPPNASSKAKGRKSNTAARVADFDAILSHVPALAAIQKNVDQIRALIQEPQTRPPADLPYPGRSLLPPATVFNPVGSWQAIVSLGFNVHMKIQPDQTFEALQSDFSGQSMMGAGTWSFDAASQTLHMQGLTMMGLPFRYVVRLSAGQDGTFSGIGPIGDQWTLTRV